MQQPINNILVALIPSKADFEIAQSQHWYRIPRRIKRVPKVLLEGRLQFLAFYHPKVFGDWAYSVRYVSAVKGITVVKRKDLVPVPEEAGAKSEWHRKANEEYYRIDISPLQTLSTPIISRKFRRFIFLETTDRKLHEATEINDLFHGTSLEEHLYIALKKAQVPAEREFYLKVNERHCFLDFAVFCRQGKINIECDGGYHNQISQINSDRSRNNLLQSAGWSVLRFSEEDVYHHMDQNMALLAETIAQYGGLR